MATETIVSPAEEDDPSSGDDASPPAPGGTGPATAAGRRRLASAAFPVLATVAFVVLVGLGWNQSSSAVVRQQIEGGSSDPGHIFGEPNSLRSDEWLVTTSYIISQDSYDYPRVNPAVMEGMDVSVASSIPSRDWSSILRPQFWGFFFLPFEQAFAFYWWLPLLLLALATYALLLQVCPGRRLLAAAGAATLVFAPFVQWWLLTGTLGCLAYSAVIVASFIAFGRHRSRRVRAGLLGVIAGATAAFLLLQYPPFQIPCAWVVVASILGWTFRADAGDALRRRLSDLGLTAAAGGVGAAIYGVFLATRWDVMELQLNAEYPGKRVVDSGTGDLAWVFSGFLDARLNAAVTVPGGLGGNASEASSFVLLGVFLTIPALWLLVRAWRRERVVDGLLVALLATLALFMSFLFVDGIDLLAKLTGLSVVPAARLYIGLGLLSLLLVAAVVREADRQEVRPPWWVVLASGLAALVVLGQAGRTIERVAPQIAGGASRWLPLALVVTALVVLAARGYSAAALVGLAAFSLVATYRVHPLRDGVYDTRETEIGQAIVEADRQDPGAWVGLRTPLTAALLAQQPVDQLSGTSLYPRLDVWRELDPSGANRALYDRYAQVSFVADPAAPAIANPAPDQLHIRLDACGSFAQRELQHVLSDLPLTDPCLHLRRSLKVSSGSYFIYDVTTRPEDGP